MAQPFDMVVGSALFMLLLAGLAFDLRTRRIPNWLTGSGIACGLIISLFPGAPTLWESIASVGIAFCLGIPFFAARAMGAGDVKFLMAAASFFAPYTFLWSTVLIAIAGGVLAITVSVQAGQLGRTLRRVGLLVLMLATAGRLGGRATLDSPGALAIPYGVAIAVGTAVGWIGGYT
jgi:prepilin peptidase CpaA